MKNAVQIVWIPVALLTLVPRASGEDQKQGAVRKALVQKYDANKNGKLDAEEHAQVLKEHDANGDGKLDKAEKKALTQAIRGNQVAKAKAGSAAAKAPLAYDRAHNVSYAPKYSMKDWTPVKRTSGEISLVEESTAESDKESWQLKFYRNKAYKCGLSGYYTFVLIEPKSAEGKDAPLWVYYHGGGGGYFDKNGDYITLKFQNKDTYNHEETFVTLSKVNGGNPVFENGRFVGGDNTMTRRLKEGYRMLVVAYGDHDQYSGKGTPYPHNPEGGEVNGLQACMSAVEYVVANFRTTHIFAHGTSAGSTGAYALGFAFAQEGIHLTGLVMDSSISTPRGTPIFLAMAANKSKIAPETIVKIMEAENKKTWWGVPRGKIEKVGVMVDPDYPFYPEAAVNAGFRTVPMLIIAGESDPFFGARAPVTPEAKAAGLGNVAWMFDGMRQAIEKQKDSPHKLLVLEKTGHVPTAKKDGHPVHDDVDAFIRKVSSSGVFPFANRARSVTEAPDRLGK